MFHHDDSDLHSKVVTVFKNGDSSSSKTLQVSLQWSIEDFLESASRRLDMPTAQVAYNSTGHEVNDCMMIEDNDILYLSCGEPFQSPSTASEPTKGVAVSMPNSVGMYDVGKYLGSGSFGEIMLGIHRVTGEQVALKFLKKSEIQCMGAVTRVTTEIQCLSSLSHENIIKLHEVNRDIRSLRYG
jgi:Protein kinase domain/KHA, dimerisation domain of potassium ion channel